MSRPVSLHSDLRPFVQLLNRELEHAGVEPVRKDELDKIDGMLHTAPSIAESSTIRCSHCGGYMGPDGDGGLTCLNCARHAASPSRMLDDLAHQIAKDLLASRNGGSVVLGR